MLNTVQYQYPLEYKVYRLRRVCGCVYVLSLVLGWNMSTHQYITCAYKYMCTHSCSNQSEHVHGVWNPTTKKHANQKYIYIGEAIGLNVYISITQKKYGVIFVARLGTRTHTGVVFLGCSGEVGVRGAWLGDGFVVVCVWAQNRPGCGAQKCTCVGPVGSRSGPPGAASDQATAFATRLPAAGAAHFTEIYVKVWCVLFVFSLFFVYNMLSTI